MRVQRNRVGYYGRPYLAGHFILPLWFLLLFSSPIHSGRRLHIYHTATDDTVLVGILNAGLKYAARGSLKIQDAEIRHLRTIAQICLCLRN